MNAENRIHFPFRSECGRFPMLSFAKLELAFAEYESSGMHEDSPHSLLLQLRLILRGETERMVPVPIASLPI